MAPAHDESAPARHGTALLRHIGPAKGQIDGNPTQPPDNPPDPQAATPYFRRMAAFDAAVALEQARRLAA